MVLADKAPARFGWLGVALFALQAYVYLFGLLPFQAGYWATPEPRFLAMLLFSALACVWCGYGFHRRWLEVPSPLPRYLILIFAWVGWQIIVTLSSASSGWRSWFGSVMYGEGTVFYISVMIFTMLAYTLWPREMFRKAMLYAVFSALVSMFLLQFPGDVASMLLDPKYDAWAGPFRQPDVMALLIRWRPLIWPDYLAFLAGWVWIVVLLANPGMSINRQLGLTLIVWAIGFGSLNKTASALYSVAAIVALFLLREVQKRGSAKPVFAVSRRVRWVAAILCLLPLIYVLASMDPNTGAGHSFEQRMHFNSIGLHALMDEPSRLWAGHGWNAFADDHLKYAVMSNIELFRDGAFHPNDLNIFGSASHSHNQPLEALLALGVPGFVLWFALALYIIFAIPASLFWRAIPVHVATVLLSYFWFPLSFFCAFIALYWAALGHVLEDASPKPRRQIMASRTWLTLGTASLTLVLLWSAVQHYRAMTYGVWLGNVLHQPYQEYRMDAILEDAGRGGERLRAIVSDYLDHLETARNRMPDDAHLWVERLLDASYLLAVDPKIGVHVGSLDLVLSFFLQRQAKDPSLDKARADSLLFSPAAVVRLAARAPKREDMATPYLYQLETTNDRQTLALVLPRLREAYPQHRCAMWLTGKLLYADPSTRDKGLRLMRAALDAKVSAIYPISDHERWDIIHQSDALKEKQPD